MALYREADDSLDSAITATDGLFDLPWWTGVESWMGTYFPPLQERTHGAVIVTAADI